MNPSTIKELIARCDSRKITLEQDYGDLVVSFLSAWIAWEAFRTRFLRVAFHQQGWLIRDVDLVLSRAKISSMRQFATALERAGLKHPHQWPKSSADAWKVLEKIEQVRHRLVHGFQRVDPERIEKSKCILCHLLHNRQWMESVPIGGSGKKGNRLVGSILGRRTSPKGHGFRTITELTQILHIDGLPSNSKSVPSLSQLESYMARYVVA